MSTYLTLPVRPRTVRATEARLRSIYEAARLGLNGASLAIAAGISPEEYRLLYDMDHSVHLAELQGRADSEMEHSRLLTEASRGGDVKATLAILERKHGWVAKSEVDVTTRTTNVDLKTLTTDQLVERVLSGEYTVEYDDTSAQHQE